MIEPFVSEDKCAKCGGEQTEDMVQCEDCRKWFHFTCVGVDAELAKRDWYCPSCVPSSATANVNPDVGAITREINALRDLLRDQQRDFANKMATLSSSTGQPHAVCASSTPKAPRACSTPEQPSLYDNELTKTQLAARHVVSAKLPPFSGNPDEWRNFKCRFDTTTKMCGFTDDENVMRLGECLSGRALKAVQCRLHQPENLKEIMESLETLFGRPEVLIENILQQIRLTPVPKMERMQSIVDYGIAVEELCATIKSSGLQEQMYRATLLPELVERLPPNLRLMWGMYRCTLVGSVTLDQFGAWMKTVTQAAVSVTPPTQFINQPSARPRPVNTHFVDSEHTSHSFCIVCEEPECPAGAECKKLLALTVDRRWSFVRGKHMCKLCLWKHGGRCHITKKCGENGCRAYHHRLLHCDDTAKPRTEATVSAHTTPTSKAILRYMPIKLHGNGKTIESYALFDEGSSVTLMDHTLLQELNLEGYEDPICLSWTGEQTRDEPHSRTVSLKISAIGDNGKSYVMPKVMT
ncbi:uncharacterized protein LOC131285222 [Anopheles ziemanni]|uniref:uncharacterized protein LOC131285222 n=1 Tax=Anopheles ziemanni TaxID=345580 RepID=UPI00265F1984|nr:uncharacterized protein LOC131285222 [Anopheles ziemanni]